jgi:DNA-binding Xre family transcriptional regulator
MARYQIKQVAANQGYTLKRLADEASLSEARLRAIANNRVNDVTVGTLERIAAQLGVPFGDVFEQKSLDEIPTIRRMG